MSLSSLAASHLGSQDSTTIYYHRTAPQNLEKLVQRKWFIRMNQGDIRDKYDFEDRVGAGTFGLVYRVRDKQEGGS